MNSLHDDFFKLSSDLRKHSEEVEELRKKYGELSVRYHQSVLMLNYIMKKVKEIDFEFEDLFKDKDLLVDCVMVTNNHDKPNKLYYDESKLKEERK